MEKAGADIIEIGIPFSDPIAEGVVIQEADLRALKAHTTVDSVFTLVQRVRAVSHVPLVFLTYLNPVFHYGIEAFLPNARKSAWTALSFLIYRMKNGASVPLRPRLMAFPSSP